MLRLLLIEAILFLIPFALYFAWRTFLDKREYETQGRFNEKPWQILIIAGGAMVLAGLVFFALTSGPRGDMVYIPAHIVDGEIVPGGYITREEAGALANVDPKERANPAQPPEALAPDAPRNHPVPALSPALPPSVPQ